MPRTQQILTSLKRGEVTRKLFGRVDNDDYNFFCDTAYNVMVEKHGGMETRHGSHFVAKTKFSGGSCPGQ